jgi:cephalosporin hydroxylase
MAAVMFDTHLFIQTLQDSGFEQKQAEAVASAFRTAQEQSETVTKHDVKELELTLKADIQVMRAEMQAMEYRMTIKLGAMMGGSVALVAAIIKLMEHVN